MMLSVLFLLSMILVIVLCYGLFYIIIFLPRNSFFGVFSHELVDIIQRVLSVFITMTWFITISVLQPMSHMCERLLHLLPCVLNDPCISGMKQIFSWLKKKELNQNKNECSCVSLCRHDPHWHMCLNAWSIGSGKIIQNNNNNNNNNKNKNKRKKRKKRKIARKS